MEERNEEEHTGTHSFSKGRGLTWMGGQVEGG